MQHALNVYVRLPPGVMIISEILIAREQSSEGGCQIPRQGAAEEGTARGLEAAEAEHADN